MKKSLFSILVLLFSVVISVHLSQGAGKTFSEGKITFDVSYPGTELDEQSKAMYPTESILYIKEDRSRMEMNTSMGSTIVISDTKKHEGAMLMDMMGSKMAIMMDSSTFKKKEGESKPKVELTNETKVIAGYTCKRAAVTSTTKEGEVTSDVWYTPEILFHKLAPEYIDGIDGFYLEYSTNQNGVTMKITARKVEQITVDEEKFIVPADYKKMTPQEMMQMFGGMDLEGQ